MQLGRLWRTVRHLRPVQVLGRARLRLVRPRPDLRPAPPRRPWPGHWVAPVSRGGMLLGDQRFRFLGVERSLAFPAGWRQADVSRLWLYNLHYFEFLAAPPDEANSVRAQGLVAQWMSDNPAGIGVGWEPFPTSLRIAHWIRWEASGGELPAGALDSLAVQLRWLSRRLEYHLLGNHLLANAWALTLGGLFFVGAEADRWLDRGLAIFDEQLPEQILADGGHYERSPMYHAAVLEQLLDVRNAMAACGEGLPARAESFRDELDEILSRMRTWLAAMTHPDGQIALFNDAALGVAPTASELEDYAGRQQLSPVERPAPGLTELSESGYVRIERGPAVAILDVAPLGPDYLPGHAHADTLSFELSLFGRRWIVNSGTSTYDEGPERQWERSTAAHNTVEVDGESSSEMWGSFRVGRRATASLVRATAASDGIVVEAWHDGYRHRGVDLVRRTWKLADRYLEIADTLLGGAGRAGADSPRAVSRLHLAPAAEGPAPLTQAPSLDWQQAGHRVRLEREGRPLAVAECQYRPQFGLRQPNRCVEAVLGGDTLGEGPADVFQAAVVTISWE